MKKYRIVFVMCFLILGIFVSQVTAHEGEDHETVVQAMHKSGQLLEKIEKSVKTDDYFAAAENLMELAKTFKSLETIVPEKGSKEEWNAIHGMLINTAFKAIGACADKDGSTVNEYLHEITTLMKKGHGIFR
jgi:hypothetical protein